MGKTKTMQHVLDIQRQLNEMQEFMAQHQAQQAGVDPNAPITLFIEYVGQCRSHPNEAQARSVMCKDCGGSGIAKGTPMRFHGHPAADCYICNGQGRVVSTEGDAYASGWVDGGWNVRFPEAVLRKYFPPTPAPFDGDFFKALLSSTDLNRSYKRLAREFHPDLGGSVKMFHKLQEAYQALKDPMLRKRYLAGVKFQQQTKQIEKEVLWKLPVSCGDVVVRGEWKETGKWQEPYWMDKKGTYGSVSRRPEEKRLHVTEIISWSPRIRSDGMVMVATWAGGQDAYNNGIGAKPFNVTWESAYEIEFDVAV